MKLKNILIEKSKLKKIKERLLKKAVEIYDKLINNNKHKKELDNILENHRGKIIIIFPPLIDWNTPLFQRPQHLAKNLAKQNVLYFYCTYNKQHDSVFGFKKIYEGCYLTNRFDLVDKIRGRKKFYDIQSTDNIRDWKFIKKILDRNEGVIYQYIDEISEIINIKKIPAKTYEKHRKILKDERCIVIPTASKLEREVKKYRKRNFKLITNGVDYEHFSLAKKFDFKDLPPPIQNVVRKNKNIVGYFGALASWFDYELIIKLSEERPDLEIVLFGYNYDNSFKKYKLSEHENITIYGPVNYNILPSYATFFDVAMIPFVINEITESTSPIKLFEYMALGKPIVTTDLPECRKYKQVLVAKDHADFIKKIDEAIELRNDRSYIRSLKEEARKNSWEKRAKEIVDMIKSH